MSKTRVTISIDEELVEAVRRETVATGSLSAWVADAIAEKFEQTARLTAMSDALAAYEAEFGVAISDEDAQAQVEYDRAHAVQIRPGRTASVS